MKVLVACEFTGVVRNAFAMRGHDAWSCDLMQTEIPGKHYRGDVRDMLNDGWDLMIAHPPCTHLAISGARHFKDKTKEQEEALEFVKLLMNAPIEKIALENPKSIISSKIKPPSQIVHPWYFGHPEVKSICLWLKNLPKLNSTNRVEGRQPVTHYTGPSFYRGQLRSRTYEGLAEAMASQWG